MLAGTGIVPHPESSNIVVWKVCGRASGVGDHRNFHVPLSDRYHGDFVTSRVAASPSPGNGTTRACAGSRFTALMAGVSHSGTSAATVMTGSDRAASVRAASARTGRRVRAPSAMSRRQDEGVGSMTRRVSCRDGAAVKAGGR